MRRLATVLLLAPVLLGLMAGPGSAKAPPEVITFEAEPFTDINPCTGEEHTIFSTLTLRIHEFEVETSERHHFNIQFFVDVRTSDGFSGKVVGPDIDNGSGLFGGEEGTGMFATMANGVISNPDTGQRFRVHVNGHFVQVNGVPKVDSFVFELDCLGA